MPHPSTELKDRTKTFALRIIKLIHALPTGPESHVISHQLLRSATSVAANYRAACRARSRAEFLAKLGVVIEEADESAFWMELICEASLLSPSRLEKPEVRGQSVGRDLQCFQDHSSQRPPFERK
jgi:four helix bundle protein